MLKRLSVVMLAVVALACADEEPRITVTPDSGQFIRGADAAVPGDFAAVVSYVVANTGGQNAYVATCADNVDAPVDRLVDGQWMPYPGDYCPTSAVRGTARIAKSRSRMGVAVIADTGLFRVRVEYSTENNAKSTAMSTAFRVR